jgi:hypothetical protein
MRNLLRRCFASTTVVVVTIVAAACTPTVTGTNSNGQAFQITIVDPQELVASASNLTPQDELLGEIGDGVHPLADPNAIAVTWIGRPCETRPNLEISETDGDPITIVLDRGPREGQVCNATEVGYGVELVLKRPVEVADLVFRIAAGQEP